MPLGAPKELSALRRFFLEPRLQTPPIRGPARLPGRGPPRSRSRSLLWLLAQFLSRPLPSFPPRKPTRFLPLPTPRSPDSAQKVGGARLDRATAQAKPFGL